MKERIIEFLKAENKSSAQLAEEIGVQPSGISHIISGRNNPSLDFVMKMLEKYKFLSTEWLLFGKGNMYKEKSMQDLFDANQPDEVASIEIEAAETPGSVKNNVLSDHINGHIKKIRPAVEKIVLFYTDKSFKEYIPEAGDN
jgi:transcriptional regulator with XRE-family HTH domain